MLPRDYPRLSFQFPLVRSAGLLDWSTTCYRQHVLMPKGLSEDARDRDLEIRYRLRRVTLQLCNVPRGRQACLAQGDYESF
jgi:hypothetical protein